MSPFSRIVIEHHEGNSRLTSARNIAPLKILNPRTHSAACHVMLSSYGGGLLQGDTVELDIKGRGGSRLFLGSQAHGHVYRSPDGRASTWSLRATLEDALAVVYLNPLIPHAESRYRQRQAWQLMGASNLVLVEWFSAGRVKTGEVFAFERVETELELNLDSELLAIERMCIEPGKIACGSPMHFSEYRQWMNIYLIGHQAKDLAGLFTHEAVRGNDTNSPLNYICSTHPIQDMGFQVRSISREREPLEGLLVTLFEKLHEVAWLGFNPLHHKQ
jgi:urease accessory protein